MWVSTLPGQCPSRTQTLGTEKRMADSTDCEDATTALLANDRGESHTNDRSFPDDPLTKRLLPVALFAALAMASTAATAYYAYASLLCKDPQDCKSVEKSQYAKVVAGATFVANLLGIGTLGYLQKLSSTNRKLGLIIWVLCRSMSPMMLLAGGMFSDLSLYMRIICNPEFLTCNFGSTCPEYLSGPL